MTIANQATFTKKNGESREMLFVRLADLPEVALDELVGSDSPPRKLPEGSELVFDLQAHDLRVFNHSTLQGTIEPYEITIDDYWSDDDEGGPLDDLGWSSDEVPLC